MRYPAEQTAAKHEKILEEASRLFRERGFDGVGIVDIMKSAGLTHGAFYSHFPSKDALVAEANARALADTTKQVKQAALGEDPIQVFAADYLSESHLRDAGHGCSLPAVGSDLAREPEVVRTACTRELQTLVDTLSGEFPWKGSDPRAQAWLYLSALVGGMTLARATNDGVLAVEILQAVRQGTSAPKPHKNKHKNRAKHERSKAKKNLT